MGRICCLLLVLAIAGCGLMNQSEELGGELERATRERNRIERIASLEEDPVTRARLESQIALIDRRILELDELKAKVDEELRSQWGGWSRILLDAAIALTTGGVLMTSRVPTKTGG